MQLRQNVAVDALQLPSLWRMLIKINAEIDNSRKIHTENKTDNRILQQKYSINDMIQYIRKFLSLKYINVTRTN